ncbi:MAG TPA: Hsp20/alpha crystallin family protein [Candidatus Binatia bacterium]|nr:Hsp20/alpha crystallin family protein [Candidatus Binatia bacterium]
MEFFRAEFDPIDALLALQRELERTVERPPRFDLGVSGRGVFPPLNVFVDKEDYVLRFEVPGIAPQDVTIEAQGRTLNVSGKRELKVPEGGSYHRAERPRGEFSRSLQLPADLDLGRAEASCQYGMLMIRVPKKEEAKAKQITVKTA